MTKYALHYVGSRVYRPDVFRWEAKHKGVNRALPAHYVKQLEYGQPVLVGVWANTLAKDDKTQYHMADGRTIERRKVDLGTANVFGYFRLSAVHIESTPEVQKWFHEHLRIVEVVDEPPRQVDRACGSYTIGATVYVDNTVKEIATLAELAEAELGVRPKLFVSGAFFDVSPPLSLEPVKFTRTLLDVEVDGWEPNWFGGDKPSNASPKAVVRFVMDYAMRRYVPKDERDRIFDKVAKDVVP